MNNLISLSIFILIMCITPGPNNLMVLASGVNFGVKRTLPHLFGICLGTTFLYFLVGIGLGAVFSQFAFLHIIIRLLALIFMVYLAWKFGTMKPRNLDSDTISGKPLSFLQAFFFQWANPKAWSVAISIAAVYISADESYFVQIFYLSICIGIIAAACSCIWTFLGVFIKKILKSNKSQRVFNISIGIILLLAIIPVLFSN